MRRLKSIDFFKKLPRCALAAWSYVALGVHAVHPYEQACGICRAESLAWVGGEGRAEGCKGEGGGHVHDQAPAPI
eukprot:365475-Chlamydomonas_euryale.AAC.14